MMPDGETIQADPRTGTVTQLPDGRQQWTEADGTIVIAPPPEPPQPNEDDDDYFYRNLAADGSILETALSDICMRVLEGIESDHDTRKAWLDNAAEAVRLLGLKIEPMRSSGADGAAPLEGMSTAHSPLLLEAVLRGQANASGELLPSAGPVKVSNDRPVYPAGIPGGQEQGIPDPGANDQAKGVFGLIKRWIAGDNQAHLEAAIPPQSDDTLAEALETDLNHYLTTTASEYYPDTKRMLFRVYLLGCEFKKVYNCPLRLRPVSESVQANDLIVNNGATDLKNATRITHRIKMAHSTLVRMQIAGAYRRTKIVQTPTENPDAYDRATASVAGVSLFPNAQSDHRHIIMECYCELDIPGMEHVDEDGEMTGLPLPYKVSIEYDTQQILEIRRDWDRDLPGLPQRRGTFVKFGFVEGLGFYGLGLMHLLGNTTNTMTSVWRLLLDSLMFGNFPGFLYSDSLGKQLTNIFRVPPGAGVPIQLNGAADIRSVAMPMPYSKPDATSMQLAEMVEASAQRLGGTADIPVGEGRQDAPVGTTIALIEQSTKIVDAVHKGLHQSQSEEFRLLVDRFRDDPQALWRFNRKPARQWEVAEFLQALDNTSVVPAADPNTPSQMHRIMKATARVQIAAMAPPGMVNLRAVTESVFRTLGDDVNEFMLPEQPAAPPMMAPSPPPPPPPDPAKMAELQLKQQIAQQEAQARQQELAMSAEQNVTDSKIKAGMAVTESADRAADRASHERIAAMRVDQERIQAIADMVKQGQLDPHVGAQMIAGIQAQIPSVAAATPSTPAPAVVPPQAQPAAPVQWPRHI